jgi:hypothetical protein
MSFSLPPKCPAKRKLECSITEIDGHSINENLELQMTGESQELQGRNSLWKLVQILVKCLDALWPKMLMWSPQILKYVQISKMLQPLSCMLEGRCQKLLWWFLRSEGVSGLRGSWEVSRLMLVILPRIAFVVLLNHPHFLGR